MPPSQHLGLSMGGCFLSQKVKQVSIPAAQSGCKMDGFTHGCSYGYGSAGYAADSFFNIGHDVGGG